MAIRRDVPGHRSYFVCSDGVIAYMDRVEMKQKNAPTFVGDGTIGEKDVVYVIFPEIVKKAPNVKDLVIGRAFVVSEMIAQAFGAPEGFRPAHHNGDTRDLALTNLNMPEKEAIEPKVVPSREQPPPPAGGDHIPCPYCPFIARDKQTYSKHIKSSHPEKYKRYEGPTDQTEGRNTSFAQRDVKRVDKPAAAKVACPHCDREFKGNRGILTHIRRAHPEIEV